MESKLRTVFHVPSPGETIDSFAAVVVTGGSSGIGKSFIQLVRKLGREPVICNLSRRNPEGKNTQGGGVVLHHFPCDLSRPAEVEAVGRDVVLFLTRRVPNGRILLINNSGIGAFGPFPGGDLARELALVDLNVRAVVALTGVLLPMLRERGGSIINVSSTVAYQPTPYAATYGASKAFLLHWSLALREELRSAGVAVLALCPGTTRTEFFTQAGMPEGRITAGHGMSPEAVAACALRALAAGRGQVVPGFLNRVIALVSARLPKSLSARLAGRIFAARGAGEGAG